MLAGPYPQVPEIERLVSLGWAPPDKYVDGIWFCEQDGLIDYPDESFEILERTDRNGFWFDHRANEVMTTLGIVSGTDRFWDIGAGTGGMAEHLRAGGYDVIAVEPAMTGAEIISSRGIPVFAGMLGDVALPDNSLGAAGLFDVIEHVADPGPLLAEARRVLSPDGVLLITVPAFKALWSEADIVAGHHRRYTRKTLRRELTQAGFHEVVSRYIFASLVPPAAILRSVPYRLGRRSGQASTLEAAEGLLDPSPAVTRALRAALNAEQAVSRRIQLPFGLSVLAAFRPGPISVNGN